MREDFLHFIWNFQYFNKTDLTTTGGERVNIFRQGFSNKDSGPDFSDCRIKINEIEWIGHVEIHYKSSDWYQHNHHIDKAYDNVVLHVVWRDDKPVKRTDNTLIPTLELKDRIDAAVIYKYRNLIENENEVLCKSHFSQINAIIKSGMIDKALIGRMESRSSGVLELFKNTGNDWEQTTYHLLASAFGFKVNSHPFLRLSFSLPLKTLQKHGGQQMQIEALLFGNAGLLEGEMVDEYPLILQKEYEFLSHKYSLESSRLQASIWKFSKVRPVNFPTQRIAQFAALIKHNVSLFSAFLEVKNIKQLTAMISHEVMPYWSDHFSFGKKTSMHVAQLGNDSIVSIAINTIVPLLVAYSAEKDNSEYMEKALLLLESMGPEKNKITRLWTSIGMPINNAFDSQGAIELYNNYCKKRACLRCNIGVAIVKSDKTNVMSDSGF